LLEGDRPQLDQQTRVVARCSHHGAGRDSGDRVAAAFTELATAI
jgi:hypothetical protein